MTDPTDPKLERPPTEEDLEFFRSALAPALRELLSKVGTEVPAEDIPYYDGEEDVALLTPKQEKAIVAGIRKARGHED